MSKRLTEEKCINISACGNRSECALTNALDIIGDKWTLLVIRDMLFVGKSQFGDFLESPEGISTNILTDRLKRLEEYGLISKKPYQKKPVRHAYFLTEKGEGLRPIMMEIIAWGIKNIEGVYVPTEGELRSIRSIYEKRDKELKNAKN